MFPKFAYLYVLPSFCILSSMISVYLKELLAERDAVAVNNLGTFRAVYAPSSMEENTLLPPTRKLSFEATFQDDSNSQALKDAVMQGEHIDSMTFDHQLDDFVNAIRSALIIDGKAAIDDIGILVKDAYGTLTLQTDQHSLWNDSFGLPKIYARPLKRAAQAPTLKEEIQTPSVFNTDTDTASAPKEEKAKEEKSHQKTDNETQPQKSNAIWLAALVPLVLIFGIFIFLMVSPSARNSVKSLFSGNNETPLSENTIPATDSTALSQNENKTETVAENTAIKTTTEPPPSENTKTNTEKVASSSSKTTTKGTFGVVIGSFSTQQAADKIKAQLEKKGFAVQVSKHPSKPLLRVIVGYYASEAEAETARGTLAGEHPAAWVLK